MTKYATSLFLICFGVMGLITLKVPDYVLPVIALVAGVAVLLQERAGCK